MSGSDLHRRIFRCRPRRHGRAGLACHKYLRPLLPLVLVTLLGALATGRIAGCTPREKGQIRTSHPPRPVLVQGVPTIRVKLMPTPQHVVSLATSGAYDILADGRSAASSGGALGPIDVVRTGGAWQIGGLSVASTALDIQPRVNSFVIMGQTSYRGFFRLLATDAQNFVVINYVDLESYLAGVLPKELYPRWSPATYRALAVAARTFASYHMGTTGVGKDWDLGAGEASQCYGGASAETETSWSAVDATRGDVLVMQSRGKEHILYAQYSAACGGVVNGAYVIRNASDWSVYDGGQECDDCAACPKYRWETVRISKGDLYAAVTAAYPSTGGQLGGAVSDIKVAQSTSWGRAIWLDLYGPSGSPVRLRAEDLRLSLLRAGGAGRSVYSMNCQIRDAGNYFEFIAGHGYGHGVGLCQWGAQGKALRGWSHEQILSFYYPTAKLKRLY